MRVKAGRVPLSDKGHMNERDHIDPSPSPAPRVPSLEVDARGLEPPQPLVVILEAVARLPEGVELCARTDRRPMHLYAQLLERGFTGISEEQPDGSFATTIRSA